MTLIGVVCQKPIALYRTRRSSVIPATTENRQTVDISVWLTIERLIEEWYHLVDSSS